MQIHNKNENVTQMLSKYKKILRNLQNTISSFLKLWYTIFSG